jgi:hypothetical protein
MDMLRPRAHESNVAVVSLLGNKNDDETLIFESDTLIFETCPKTVCFAPQID